MDFKEYVYCSLMGALKEPYPEVENLFAEGKLCEQLYKNMYETRLSLYNRLGVYDDHELDTIVGCLLSMQREVAFKMYDYGVKFGKK